jgi:serine protease
MLALTATMVVTTVAVLSAFANESGAPQLPAWSALSAAANAPEEMVSSLIVKPRTGAGAQLAAALQAFDARGLSKAAATPLTVLRQMSGEAYVVKLDQPLKLSEARVISARLMHNDPSIEYAEPDIMLHPLTTTPTDPGYTTQWHYFAPNGTYNGITTKGGANLPNVWDFNKGLASITVAVIDTGYRQHVDFGPVLQGYDFITDATRANDGGGRDSDAQDPGDWVAANECYAGSPASNSSWHGTHVTGTIAALMNNGQGGTGVAPNVKILPVRVLGKCGGLLSDIADGMRWAAGLSVPLAPANANPAHVQNLSLGGAGACGSTFQTAVTNIVNAGKVVVAATGNGGTTSVGTPANCSGVIAVTAHAIDGDKASYADVGTETAISAPGGGCGALAGGCSPGVSANGPLVYSTLNSGLTTPVADSYGFYLGTSMAAPHVAGVVALMFSARSNLTPAQIRSYLTGAESVRPFPPGTYCTTGSGSGKCGAGLLDAQLAVAAIPTTPPTVTITNPSQVVLPASTVLLSGTATPAGGSTISTYSWAQVTGASVGTITNSDQATASFTAPATGTYSFELTVTDTSGLTGKATATVRVNSPPVLNAVGTQYVLPGSTLTFTVTATDADGDTPIFVSVSLPAGATLSAAGAFSWPNANPLGNYTLTYFARDNDANSAQGTVNLSVVESLPSNGGGGGGCTIARTGSGDSMFAALFLLSVAVFAWRAARRRT